jgi:hypothetical protein
LGREFLPRRAPRLVADAADRRHDRPRAHCRALARPSGRSAGGTANNAIDNASAICLATVTRPSLASRTNVNGTLGTYGVVNRATGTLTAMPAIGE